MDETSLDSGAAARETARQWRGRLEGLALRIREAVRLIRGESGGDIGELARPTGRGAGDWTFALDEGPEAVALAWLEECARESPLSLLTEDSGWRHRGPDGRGGSLELPGFDHGGPRLALDPVDGTRNLMFDLRSAWTIISFAGAGKEQPRFEDLTAGLLSELPRRHQELAQRLWALRGGGCELAIVDAQGQAVQPSKTLDTGSDGRVDNGFFCFFSYDPRLRARIASLAADFFDRLERAEGADRTRCYDDQYISSGGQLANLALGNYRFVADLRTHSRGWSAAQPQTAKAYDMAGAALCAQEAGAIVEDPSGEPLSFPIDAQSPVDFVGYANRATHRRLAHHFLQALRRADEGAAGAHAPGSTG